MKQIRIFLPLTAQKAAMSPRTFAPRFREQTGTTPHQWLMHQRLLSAQRHLEQSGETVDQVAEAVGFRQYFSLELGTTPTAYRRQFSTRVGAPAMRRRI